MSHATDVRAGHCAAGGRPPGWPGRGPIEVDPAKWPDVAVVPGSPVRAAIARLLFARVAARLPLRVRLASGAVFGGGGPGAPVLTLHRPEDFYQRVGAAGLIGFGESYMAGDWDADDLTGLLTVLACQVGSLVPRPLQWLRNAYVRRQPPDEDASETGARRNIQRHYDLSNELFALFLDETMTYSSALFEEDGQGRPVASGRRFRGQRFRGQRFRAGGFGAGGFGASGAPAGPANGAAGPSAGPAGPDRGPAAQDRPAAR